MAWNGGWDRQRQTSDSSPIRREAGRAKPGIRAQPWLYTHLALETHVFEVEAPFLWRRSEQCRSKHNRQVGHGHLVGRVSAPHPSTASAHINTLISRCRAREAFTALSRGHTRQKDADAAPVQMTHEEFQRRVIRIRQLVDLFMQPDMPQSVVLVP
jgi:hypothetical protein